MVSEDSNEESSDGTRDQGPIEGNNAKSDVGEPKSEVGTAFDRRSLLKLTGAAAASIAGAGLAGTASAAVTRQGITFDTVLDAVENLGMDPTGNVPIDAAFESAMRSGTLIEFPPGEYLVTSHHDTGGLARFGVRGLGTHRNDVQFLPASGAGIGFMIGGGTGPWLIENVSFNERSDDVSTIYVDLGSSNGGYVGNVEWLGRSPLDDASDYHINADVYDQNSVIVFEEVYAGLDEPAVPATYPRGIAFLRAGPSHAGEIVIRDCVIHERNSAATRMTAGPGVVTVEGGEFVNNQNANIRFAGGGHPSKRSSVTGTYVKIDGSRNTSDAIRLDGEYVGPVFEDVTVEWSKETGRGIVAAPDWGGAGGAEFYNCVVRNDGARTPTVNAESTQLSNSAIVIENCDFTGSGGGFYAYDRPGSVIRNSCLDMPNASISGFTTENVSRSGCRLPGDSTGGDSTSGDTNDGTSGDTTDGTSGDTTDGTSGDTTDGTDSGSVTTENTLTVSGTGTATNYRVSVSKELVGLNSTLESYDTIEGSTANGWVTTTAHVDEYGYNGEVLDFEIVAGGPVEITRNGQSVTVADLGGNEQPSSAISVADRDGLSVTLSATDSADPDGTVVAYDWNVNGTTYQGETVTHTFSSPGTYPVTLTVEDDAGATTTARTNVTVTYANDLRIEGNGTQTRYFFEVSDALDPVGSTIEDWDDTTDTAATGWVTDVGHVDEFAFAGQFTRFEFLEGEADVYVNGQEIDPTASELRIQGTGKRTNYSVEVSGSLEPVGDTVERWDEMTETTATGWVTSRNHVDRFVFYGEISTLGFLRGEADVYVDGEQIDPSGI